MKKKIIITLIIIIVMSVAFALGEILTYKTTVEYSKIAVQQLNDDSAYSVMKTQGSVKNIVYIFRSVIGLMLGIALIRTWLPKSKKGGQD